jgi:hypothetical protein
VGEAVSISTGSADAEQTDAFLEPKIYRLARLEILVIRKELEDGLVVMSH